MIVRISSFERILSIRAFCTLRILPRSGRIAWKLRSRPCFAEPPAESPSTRYSSVSLGSETEQSASFPGKRPPSSPLFLRTSSRALRAAFVGVDVVDEREGVVVVAIVVLHRTLDLDPFSGRLEGDRLGVERLAVAEQVFHELREPPLVEERLLLQLSLALVFERDRE